MPAELEFLTHFHFLRPVWALLLLPWLAIIWVMGKKETSRDMFGGIIAPHLLEHLRVERFYSPWLNPRRFSQLLFILLVTVLMGPSWRQQPSPLSQDQAALVILLDVSTSMEQQDVQPSRLRRAKQKIGELLNLRPDKPAALIVYAGSAHTVLSLTADREILDQYLAAIKPGIMPRPGKFPEYALTEVDAVLSRVKAPASIVLFSDGVGADTVSQFEHYFAQHPHQLLVVGMGQETLNEGQVPLERRALENLASASGGRYIELSIDNSDVRRINRGVESHYIVIEDSALPWLDSGYPLVFPALLLFLLWFRRGWTLSWGWLLVPILLLQHPDPVRADATVQAAEPASHWFADLWLTPDQQGRLLMQLGDYREAARRFEDTHWQAMAWYYAEEFMLAAEYFSRSDSDDALFNEANARTQAGDYVRAVNRYELLLVRNPGYPGADQNRAQVRALIDEINRLSESQTPEDGVSGEDKELGGDDVIPADGAEEISWQQAELVQFSAEEILQDPATAEMWLRGVQQDPSNFLAVKFSMQLSRQTVAPKP
ncbi:MAG: Ca-activated chloride channel family protein [Halieaceae bacterium]|jgi:Ca-activated chloride channel family protein